MATEKEYIIIESKHQGAIHASTSKIKGKKGKAKGFTLQEGPNDVPAEDWPRVKEALKKTLGSQYSSKIIEPTMEVTTGQGATKKTTEQPAQFHKLDTEEQLRIASTCMDTKTLKKWKKLKKLDASVMTAINEQIDKIVNHKAGDED